MNEPRRDKTPAEAYQDLVTAIHELIEHASTIAHAKKAFYDAYVAEGFTPAEALELVKNVGQV